MTQGHKDNPELWFRPSRLPLPVLLELIESRRMTATPRLGARDGNHLKGYEPGQVVTVRVLDDNGVEHARRKARIEAVTIRPLSHLTPGDLQNTFYHHWEEVREDFELFEKRSISDAEEASIIEFSYL